MPHTWLETQLKMDEIAGDVAEYQAEQASKRANR